MFCFLLLLLLKLISRVSEGLEVDFALKEETPHLPHVSCEGLREVQRLVVKPVVAIDVPSTGSSAK